MKKSTLAFILIILALGAYFVIDSQWPRSLITGILSKDIDNLNQYSLSFMEDIKFKDFDKAATYHHPEDQKNVDIPYLLERLFQIKPEFLDIMEYKILDTSLDSTKTRGRVKIKTKVHLLNKDLIKNYEFILYYRLEKGNWYMELESSLK